MCTVITIKYINGVSLHGSFFAAIKTVNINGKTTGKYRVKPGHSYLVYIAARVQSEVQPGPMMG